jgi:hypothetical protein
MSASVDGWSNRRPVGDERKELSQLVARKTEGDVEGVSEKA